MEQLTPVCKEVIPASQLRWLHDLTSQSHKELPMRMIFNTSAFTDFAVSGDLDFYNKKVTLTPDQRMRCIQHIQSIIRDNPNISVKLINGRLISDFQYVGNQNIILGDTTSVLRLVAANQFSLNVINHSSLKDAFSHYFDEIWAHPSDVVVSDREEILQNLDHVVRQIQMISKLKY